MHLKTAVNRKHTAMHSSCVTSLRLCCYKTHAGILGYAWVAVLHYWLKLSYTVTLLIATAMPGLWLVVFHGLMRLSSRHGSSSSSSTTKLVNYNAVPSAAEGNV